jgi:Cu-processing system permease protein
LIYEPTSTGLILVITGCLLSVIFVSIALLATVTTRDKAKGIGKSILLWLYFALIFDGLVLFLLFQFAEYPLEKMMMAISGLNPIDLSRIIVLLRLDVYALMGYTGAVFKDFFCTTLGFERSWHSYGLLSVINFYKNSGLRPVNQHEKRHFRTPDIELAIKSFMIKFS